MKKLLGVVMLTLVLLPSAGFAQRAGEAAAKSVGRKETQNKKAKSSGSKATKKAKASKSQAKPTQQPAVDLVVVVGAAGEAKYAEMFSKWSRRWQQAGKAAKANLTSIGGGKNQTKGVADRDKLQQTLTKLQKDGTTPLWLVYIGHGTFGRKRAKLNLIGRDVADVELATWLNAFTRPVVVIHSGAASAPFINRLSQKGRVVVTATKSGFESNFAYFGDYLSQAITDPKSDLDKDEQISLLEAFLSASRQVAQFYKQNGRLATEQALIDDNGDAKGTPASFFRGIRVAKQAAQGGQADGLRANQLHLVKSASERNLPPKVRQQRDKLEQQLEELRAQKGTLEEDDYYQQLEKILIKIARLYSS